ncbi:DUF58 domain-containing protein [Hydrogenobacter sp. T-2]|uniref:DUF58 domain-containing protein n=1 Tax=Pampinifervens diazotrophicum TaxID=1632018 RepID=UPI002B2616EB|nr:DUF58 domain-containing protein [Hydrogenobacter sp. T-2]WPM32265.1 DUF58 domain-containing protein [Hydrogenobacter sp. T-2]
MKTRYKVRVNRVGVIFIGITIFLGVAAVNTANNLLYLVVSYMLSFMLLSGILSLYNLRELEVVLIPPEEVYAGTMTELRVLVKNRKRLPAFLVGVRIGEGSYVFPLILGGKEVEGMVSTIFERRGHYSSINLEVASSFPIGLFERFYSVEVPVNLVVFPKPLAVAETYLSAFQREKGQAKFQSRSRGYEELYGVREYSNEPLKLIHWKISAKTGSLYVKDMVEESAPPVVLSLDMVEGTLEERVSKLAYLVRRFTSEGRQVGLRLTDRTIQPSTGVSHKRRLLSELALL